MNAIHDYIVTTDNRYNNTVDVDGKELIVNTEITERDAEYVNRIATVLAVPSARDTDIQVGDEVVVHHNVFRRWYDMQGREKNGGSYIDDTKYKVSEDQVFAYKRDGEWKAALGFCFVEPIIDESPWRENRYEELKGVLTYTDKYLDHLGISEGTIVGFTPASEYEFTIDDKTLYRIYSTQITINYGTKEDTNTETISSGERLCSADQSS